jgi:hypothetical protein
VYKGERWSVKNILETPHLLPASEGNSGAYRREGSPAAVELVRAEFELRAPTLQMTGSFLGQAQVFWIVRSATEYSDDSGLPINERARRAAKRISKILDNGEDDAPPIPVDNGHAMLPLELRKGVIALLGDFLANSSPAGGGYGIIVRGGGDVDRLRIGDMLTNDALERCAEERLFASTAGCACAPSAVNGLVDRSGQAGRAARRR